MSYGVKYRIKYKDWHSNTWQHDILLENYTGSINNLYSSSNPCRLNYLASDEDMYVPIRGSSLEIDIMEFTDSAHMELILKDKAAKVISYKNDNVFWRGWTISDNYRTIYNMPPKVMTITAVCGLSFLKSVNYAAGSYPVKINIKTILKQAFNAIGHSCDIYESLDVYGDGMDTNTPSIEQIYIDPYKFYKDVGSYDSLYNIISYILKDLYIGGRVMMVDGCWHLNRVSQMDKDIVYRRYDSDFVLQDTKTESKIKLISHARNKPASVPVDRSLYKELVRPYSQLTIDVDYEKDNNIFRYWHKFTRMPGIPLSGPDPYGFPYSFDGSVVTVKSPSYVPTYNQGLKWWLGYVDLERIRGDDDSAIMEFSITYEARGQVRMKLFIEDELMGKTYDCGLVDLNNDGNYYWGERLGAGTFTPLDHIVISVIKNNDLVTISKNIRISRRIKDRVFIKGDMYFQIIPPQNIVEVPNAYAGEIRCDLKDVKIEYLECVEDELKNTLTISETTNAKEMSMELYSNITYRSTRRTLSGYVDVWYPYRNPHLVYPGLLYSYGGGKYYPIREFFIKGIGVKKTLDELMIQEVMSYRSGIILKVSGTLLSEFDFNTVIKYHDRLYLIISLVLNSRSSMYEVTLLEIGIEESFLLDEDGELILTEDEQNIQI